MSASEPSPMGSVPPERISYHEHLDYLSGQRIDVLPEQPVWIEMTSMKKGELELYTAEGDPLGKMVLNKHGNKMSQGNSFTPARNDLSYTYTLPNGYTVLLPVPEEGEPPVFFEVGDDSFRGYLTDEEGNPSRVSPRHMKIRIDPNGAILLRDMKSAQGTSYELVESIDTFEEEESDIITQVDRQILVTRSWGNMNVREEQSLHILSGDGKTHVGTLYKVPNVPDCYRFYDEQTGETSTLVGESSADGANGENLITHIATGGKRLQFRFYQGQLQVRSDILFFGLKHSHKISDASPLGESAEFKGKINGGRDVYASTDISLGGSDKVPPKYLHRDEDSITVNYRNGTLVVCDGLGGQPLGEHASHLAADWIANSGKPLKQAIYDAYNALRVLSRVLVERGDNHPSNTAFVAAQLKGDVLDYAYIGDCQRILIRDGIVYRSHPHAPLDQMIRDGDVTEREAYTDPKFQDLKRRMTTSLYWQFRELGLGQYVDQAQYGTIHLQKGDILLLCTDGLENLTDEEILMSVDEESSLEDCAACIKRSVAEKNNTWKHLRDFDDGLPPALVDSARDSASFVLYRQD